MTAALSREIFDEFFRAGGFATPYEKTHQKFVTVYALRQLPLTRRTLNESDARTTDR
jgi:hypothetical protein